MKSLKIWSCKIGEAADWTLPPGADHAMRQAVKDAYRKLTDKDADFIFSGWGLDLTASERTVLKGFKK